MKVVCTKREETQNGWYYTFDADYRFEVPNYLVRPLIFRFAHERKYRPGQCYSLIIEDADPEE